MSNATNTINNEEIVMDDAELQALEDILAAELELDDDEIVLEEETTVNDLELEAAVAEVHLEETKSIAYEEQEAGEDLNTDTPKKKKAKAKPVRRKTMTGAKKSAVAIDKMGAKVNEFALEVSDAKLSTLDQTVKRDTFIAGIDDMAIKVGEKAVNLVAYASNDAKLSIYIVIALTFLIDKGEMTAKALIEHMQDQTANGIKGYGLGTARSQSHQIFQLFPEFKIGTLNERIMKLNPDSLIVAKFSSK